MTGFTTGIEQLHFLGRHRGHPLKVKSSKKNTSPIKKITTFFCNVSDQNKITKIFMSASVTSFCWFTVFLIRTSHPSGSRLVVFQAKCLRNTALTAISAVQKIFSAVSCPIVRFQILWLLTNPIVGSRHSDRFSGGTRGRWHFVT